MKLAMERLRSGVDPRYFQIASLMTLLTYGVLALGFDVSGARIAVTLGSALATQALCSRLTNTPFDPRSALISGLSLCLLLRTPHHALAGAGAALAVASKFLIRRNGKHVFNPTNLALAALLLVSGEVWTSAGQWGFGAFFAFLIACAGWTVVTRSSRTDVTLAFLAFHAALMFGRAYRLGDPLAIPLHQLQSGSLLLFAFFMISDPRTTPDSRLGRIVFAGLVALGGYYVSFRMFQQNGLIFSLVIVSMLTPLMDWLSPGRRFEWKPAPPAAAQA